MKDTGDEAAGSDIGLHGQRAALQVICLGHSGGPSEEDVTGFLVRSTSSNWSRNSLLAVDAGSHLAPITRILERDFPSVSLDRSKSKPRRSASNGSGNVTADQRMSTPPGEDEEEDGTPPPEPSILKTGPFAGLSFPNESARANALHVLRTYISTYLITHPHLDHISGFAINTAAFAATSKPKTLAALPSTVNAMKTHIFNDVIWPNLTDEDGGVGFVTFQRLKEGGDVMVGEGEGRGYIDVCDGLGVRAFKVSHGVCTKSPPSHQHRGSIAGLTDAQAPPYNGSIVGTSQDLTAANMSRSLSISGLQSQSQPGTPGGSTQRQSLHATGSHPSPHLRPQENSCVVDSTAFFLRDEQTHREVVIFGDVEPDSISLSPRNYVVWQEAARKIAQGILGGIFIECSYDDSQADAVLFGHLNPKHLIAELQNLATKVHDAKALLAAEKAGKKRKRSGHGSHGGPNGLDSFSKMAIPETAQKRSKNIASRALEERRRSSVPDAAAHAAVSSNLGITSSAPNASHEALNHYQFQPQQHPSSESTSFDHSITSPRSVTFPPEQTASSAPRVEDDALPLSGIKVIIIHVKDTLKDGPHVSENILKQLKAYEEQMVAFGQGLGCEFVISKSGECYWF